MTTTEIISYFRDLMDNERESSKGYTRSEYNQMEYFLRDAERRQKNAEAEPNTKDIEAEFSNTLNTLNSSGTLVYEDYSIIYDEGMKVISDAYTKALNE